ncbi:hypothetical protein M2C68_20875, partial [Pseudomonas sp. BAgro211]|nr:hypothetical protein [Pseudomonas sp. BAgro211]
TNFNEAGTRKDSIQISGFLFVKAAPEYVRVLLDLAVACRLSLGKILGRMLPLPLPLLVTSGESFAYCSGNIVASPIFPAVVFISKT